MTIVKCIKWLVVKVHKFENEGVQNLIVVLKEFLRRMKLQQQVANDSPTQLVSKSFR